jgi:apolipoprotein N-acyltransferase
MRAIEHRRWMIRSTNSGISALIDPAGRVVARTALLEAARLRGRVGRLELRTLYGRVGDWPGWLAAASFVVLVWHRPGAAPG